MSVTQESRVSTLSSPEINLTTPADRRADIDAKQALVADLLREAGCDGLLVLQPENFSWLTAGGAARGVVDPRSVPALYFSADGRWLVCSNVDTQRLFDEEIDGLGFQLKEWPWHLGREQLLADLCQGRNVACDGTLSGCKYVGEELARRRRVFGDYEQACYRALGQVLSHALEATGRTLVKGDTEREVAGQLSHRLMHRGVLPVQISVYADGRAKAYRQAGFTAAPVNHSCVMLVTARKYGLCARASRTIVFGQPDAAVRKDHDAACKVSANYVASSWPDSVPRQILTSGQRIYQLVGAENEWRFCPQGHLIGWSVVEQMLTPQLEELLQNHTAITWCASVGTALSCDTFFITEEGPRAITAVENWPLKRIRIQGAEFVRPDILSR